MIGFGALREMNDRIRQNLELLKSRRKAPFQKINARAVQNPFRNEPKLSESERILIVQTAWRASQKEKRIQILVMTLIVLFTIIMLTIMLGGFQ